MKLEAGRLPRQATRLDQPPRNRLKVSYGLFVIHFVNGNRQDFFPVIHQPMVLLKSPGDLTLVVGPANTAKVGHPARHGDVAQVAPAMDKDRFGKHDRKQTDIHIIVGHLVDDSRISTVIELIQVFEMELGQALHGWRVEQGDASARSDGAIE